MVPLDFGHCNDLFAPFSPQAARLRSKDLQIGAGKAAGAFGDGGKVDVAARGFPWSAPSEFPRHRISGSLT
jgi:hypothetical protein